MIHWMTFFSLREGKYIAGCYAGFSRVSYRKGRNQLPLPTSLSVQAFAINIIQYRGLQVGCHLQNAK